MVHKGVAKNGEERVILVHDKQQEKIRSRPKEIYRVRNWAAYDAALVNRGSLTI